MIGPEGPRFMKPSFRFASCTGDTTENLLDFSKPVNNQLNQVNKDTTFVTLSIGGNDALFSSVLEVCVYGKVIGGVDTSKFWIISSRKSLTGNHRGTKHP